MERYRERERLNKIQKWKTTKSKENSEKLGKVDRKRCRGIHKDTKKNRERKIHIRKARERYRERQRQIHRKTEKGA